MSEVETDYHRAQVRKAMTFYSVMAGMGCMLFTSWRPKKFVGVKRPDPDDPIKQARREKHAAGLAAAFRAREERRERGDFAIACMRENRREKRIKKAENLLREKRRRKAAQWDRHIHRLTRLDRSHFVPAPHFIAH